MDEQNKMVKLVGNAWIVCQSKTRPGHTYYFNTVTGNAAWNLSDIEIDKANKAKQIPYNQPGVSFEKCSEPKEPVEPPVEEANYTHPLQNKHLVLLNVVPPNIYNKQIINNKFTDTALTSNNTNSMLSYSGPETSSNMWPLPQNQVFLASSMNSGHNKTETCYSVYQTRNNIYSNNKIFNSHITDLRQKLKAKRSNSNNSSYRNDEELQTEENRQNCFLSENDKIKEEQNSEDSFNLGDIEGMSQQYDLTPLRILASSSANKNCWYIVPDTNVVLVSFNFIKLLLNSDVSCNLMVPYYVKMKLQNIAVSMDPQKFAARGITRLLNQYYETQSDNIVFEESTEETTYESASLINCCLNQLKLNYHVVLLSNSEEMLNYKYKTPVPIFTIHEVKNLVTNKSNHRLIKPTTAVDRDQFIITVTNNKTDKKVVEKILSTAESGTETQSHIKTTKSIPQNNNISMPSNEKVTVPKCSINTGVQTDITSFPSLVSNNVDKDIFNDLIHTKININDNTEPPNRFKSNIINDMHENTNLSIMNGNEMRLKCNIGNQNLKNNNKSHEKKQYNWRRRKITFTPQSNKVTCIDKGVQKMPIENINSHQKLNIAIGEENISNKNVNLRGPIHSCSQVSVTILNSENSKPDIQRRVTNNPVSKDANEIIINQTSEISNTVSNIDTKSILSKNQQKSQPRKETNKNVMFEVSNQNMEDSLRMRSDEWVSRFVQIMEEVLTEMLRQNPPFTNSKWPPPWTIREATHCITLKYYKHPDVLDAAKKLYSIVSSISDSRGAISNDLEPSKYMKMYSYGVYLIDTLQDVCNNCEDLQTAAESLKKLLNDIETPNPDSYRNDPFNFNSPDILTPMADKNEVLHKSINKKHGTAKYKNKQGKDKTDSKISYNLRSKKTTTVVQEEPKAAPPEEVKFIRNIDIKNSFFEHLKLQRNANSIQSEKENTAKSSTSRDDESSEFENNSESITEEHYSEHEECIGKEYMENDKIDQDKSINQKEFNETIKPIETDVNREKEIDSFTKFKHFIYFVRETFLKVYKLCDEYEKSKELKNTKMKQEIKEKAKLCLPHMEGMCSTLDRILDREKSCFKDDTENSKRLEYNITSEYNFSKKYTNIITKYKECTETCIKSIELIIREN